MRTHRNLPADTILVMDELLKSDLSIRARERAQAIRAMALGFTNQQIAILIGKHKSTISEWRSRYLKDGISWVKAEGWGGARR